MIYICNLGNISFYTHTYKEDQTNAYHGKSREI